VVAGQPQRLCFVVTAEEAHGRLDRVCATRLAPQGLSRSSLERLCGQGLVALNDRPSKPAARVQSGDQVVVVVPPPELPSAGPEPIPLSVLHEDDAVLVVDKPAGLVVHPARGHPTGTLVNAVAAHTRLEDAGGLAAFRPGIVHRLDKDTSGVLVVAKTVAAREALKEQFQSHSIERRYVAIVQGSPPDQACYDTPHGRHPTDRLRFTGRVGEGRRAVTHVRVLERLLHGRAAVVSCRLQTGRTHQIRVHLSEAGFPLLADSLYGRRPADPLLQSVAQSLGRQALHAEVLGFVHPVSRQFVRFVSPLPRDLRRALDTLRGAVE
jgi:23S rRNA pseudouridine1911/1915/1917 synthase